MNAAAWFVAGWISASVFIALGVLIHHLRRQPRDPFQDTAAWVKAHEQEPLHQVGRRWYPPLHIDQDRTL